MYLWWLRIHKKSETNHSDSFSSWRVKSKSRYNSSLYVILSKIYVCYKWNNALSNSPCVALSVKLIFKMEWKYKIYIYIVLRCGEVRSTNVDYENFSPVCYFSSTFYEYILKNSLLVKKMNEKDRKLVLARDFRLKIVWRVTLCLWGNRER